LAEALPPGSTIGILGGGQLGRMLALAAARLGFKCHIYCPDPQSPAFDVSAAQTVADYDDTQALSEFARAVDVVTYEFENVPVTAAEQLAETVPVRPNARALAISQDRRLEKEFVASIGIGTAAFAAFDDRPAFDRALGTTGLPAVLKTRRLGYDGKGQAVIRWADEAGPALEKMRGAPAILEKFVPFKREISVIGVRGLDGSLAAYDPAENVHREGILNTSTVPARIDDALAAKARDMAAKLMSALDYVGVIGVELFVVGEGADAALLVNEFAPRVHNSGHWTEDACVVSQFENHIRAVAGWPLGETARHADVVMTNLIGAEAESWRRLAAEPGARLHLYGKREARAGRKMGHVNRLTPPGYIAEARAEGGPARAMALDHVLLAMPEGREAEARAFYAGLLGIPEIRKPANLARRGGCWFQSGRLQVHLGVEKDFRPAQKAHPALIVGDLAAVSAALARAGHPVVEDEPLAGFSRVYVNDPFGNRIELMQPEARRR
jgi:5-(carboxyamino)imidazole ribonucleotide synthase